MSFSPEDMAVRKSVEAAVGLFLPPSRRWHTFEICASGLGFAYIYLFLFVNRYGDNKLRTVCSTRICFSNVDAF